MCLPSIPGVQGSPSETSSLWSIMAHLSPQSSFLLETEPQGPRARAHLLSAGPGRRKATQTLCPFVPLTCWGPS